MQLVGTSDFLKTCNFQDCTIKKPGGEPKRMEKTFIKEINDDCGGGDVVAMVVITFCDD